MAKFDLQKGADKFGFDTSGNGAVTKNGASFGVWTTDDQNKLVARPTDGSDSVSFDVVWVFTEQNELSVKNGNTVLCNFHADRRPRYDLFNAVLKVKPDFTGAHQFALHGEWDLRDDMKLTFTTPDKQVSVFDGQLNDLRSRFNYRVRSKVAGHESHTAQFLFVGRWRKDPADAAKLNFIYQRANGTEDTFVMAGTLTFNKADNQMVYRFDAATQSHQIDFVGSLRVSPDFQITYSIANQIAQGSQSQVVASDIVIDAVFANPAFEGGLSLAVKRPNGGETVFTLSGQFTHIRVSGTTNLAVGFSITSGTGATPTTVAIAGTFSFKNQSQLQFTFAHNAKQTTIGISATQLKLGTFATANASATIQLQDGSLKSVEVMFGVTFPIKGQALGAVKP